ncbi:hypothetical protein QOZ80_1AG0018910 [Eleusine coracana subsp. coracana]|nr:hypothetical protein QOZ80_1AG0018910 [Eleusine coracana subsp. coracana]
MEALQKSKANLTVYVHPSNAKDVHGAVARQLSSLLFTYEDRFDGVLLGHEFEVVSQKDNSKTSCKAKILNGLVPYFGVPVDATLLLFSPRPDMILEGKVEMLGKESIHAVVFGVFSVAIMADDIYEKFKFRRKSDGGRFVSLSDNEHVIKKGSLIRFSVKRVDTEMNCHMTGSLIPPHTGSMHWLSEHDDESVSEICRFAAENFSSESMLGNINIKFEQDEQEYGSLNNINGIMNYERLHKSRKRSFEER